MNLEMGRQNIIIMFWKLGGNTDSFLGMHKSERDIYIGFSPAFHLQCMSAVMHSLVNSEDKLPRLLLMNMKFTQSTACLYLQNTALIKKENKIFLIYKEIQNRSGCKVIYD
jgi:hypothetical protein